MQPPGCKPLKRDFRWTSVLAAELCQQFAYLRKPVFCDITFSRWGLVAEDLDNLYWSPLHSSAVVNSLSTRLLTLEVRSIHCLENLGQRTPRDGTQQAYPRRTSSPLHRFESQKSRVVILLETDLLIRFLLLYILSEFAVAVNSKLVLLNPSVAKYYAALCMIFLLKAVLVLKLNNLILLCSLYKAWTALVCMQVIPVSVTENSKYQYFSRLV